ANPVIAANIFLFIMFVLFNFRIKLIINFIDYLSVISRPLARSHDRVNLDFLGMKIFRSLASQTLKKPRIKLLNNNHPIDC
ncbi:MAG: hypothetical protein Q8N58_01585, partial [bacterium]|nr:hypothetical protein [bacterium]